MNPLKLGTIAIRRDVVSHPLLGDAHVIEHEGRAITAMSALDWERPARIPVVAEPGKLPPGAGGLLLNHIAELARRAGVPALRYAGPYPTPALYRALLRSFRAAQPEEVFTRNVLDRALTLARDEVPVDFAPAPYIRVEHAHGHSEVRDGVERTVIDGTAYEVDGSPARIAGSAAEVWFGDRMYARIAGLDPRGAIVEGPHAPPPLDHPIVGKTFPLELRDVLGEVVSARVLHVLAEDAHRMLREHPLVWADLGTRAARATRDGFEVHGALWTHVGAHGLARLADALAEALVPVVTSAILARLLQARSS